MKQSLAAAAAMLVLAAAVLTAANTALDATAVPTPYTAVLSRGDAAAAEGLRFRTAARFGSCLRWDTVYDVGANTWESEESFAVRVYNNAYTQYDDVTDRPSWESFNTRYINAAIRRDDALGAHLRQAAEARNRENGYESSYAERVMLRDYYETYPLYLASDAHSVGQLFDGYGDYDELTFPMFDRLRIPVGDADWMEPSVVTGSSGMMYLTGDTRLRTQNRFTPLSLGCENGTLVTVGFSPDAEPQAEWAPEGFGLWYIPFIKESGTSRAGGGYAYTRVDADNAQLVCELDIAAQRVVGLQYSGDRSEVLLTTAEDGQYVLRILDAADFRCKQIVPLAEVGELLHWEGTVGTEAGFAYQESRSDYPTVTYHSEDDLLVAAAGKTLVVLLPEGGGWAVEFTTPLLWPTWQDDGTPDWGEAMLADAADAWYYGSSTIDLADEMDRMPMCWQDGKLALAANGYSGEQTLVEVYDRTGLRYGALLDAGLSAQERSGFGFSAAREYPELVWE